MIKKDLTRMSDDELLAYEAMVEKEIARFQNMQLAKKVQL